MRILFITSSFYPNIGGVEKHVLQLSLELLKLKHSVTVLTQNNNDSPEQETYQGIEIVRFSRQKNRFSIWLSLYKLRRHIKSSNIIHLHDYTPFLWLFPFLLLYRRKFFITFHGWEGKVPPLITTKLLRKSIERISSGSIAIGHFIIKWYNQKPTKILYGGVVQNEIQPPGYINTLSPNFLFYGRLNRDTEIENYLKFFKLFSQTADKSIFTIIGNGPLKNSLKKYSQKNKLPCAFVAQTDNIAPFIKKSDIVFTGGYLGILESLAKAKLVCAIYSNKLKRDYLELSPFKDKIIIASSPIELNNYIKQSLSSHKNLIERITKNFEFIKDFTWHEIANEYSDLWK